MKEKFEGIVSKQGRRHIVNVPAKKHKQFPTKTPVEVWRSKELPNGVYEKGELKRIKAKKKGGVKSGTR